ncbi:cytochrome o ubiquinol oxidase subunit III [Paenibacillus sp. YYML68]|uniref:cytochrome o ubiquinol oxidase subunit III n=1 Tax=Paenibacillus sp. YYML68 TaxID=2909250 RepID=UPI002491305C|nr:cytochrome o ubiquinol oxidase subunit III [Paenibacillus sp. YYML68]
MAHAVNSSGSIAAAGQASAHPNAHGHGHDSHSEEHEHEHESLKTFGFWIFLITDCILFGTLFAVYVVLRANTNGGPTPEELFHMPGIIAETFILLTSSFTSGLAVLAMHQGNKKALIGWLGVTALLGAAFISLEIAEFVTMVHEGATIGTSAFLSAFFTLVGTHGLHVSIGLVWMVGLMLQLRRRGITPVTKRKVEVISLYWHFLDVVWIFVFTVVYLMGVM